jgi:hypothetical protein
MLQRIYPGDYFIPILNASGTIDLIVAITTPTIKEASRVSGRRIKQPSGEGKTLGTFPNHPAALFERRSDFRRHDLMHTNTRSFRVVLRQTAVPCRQ